MVKQANKTGNYTMTWLGRVHWKLFEGRKMWQLLWLVVKGVPDKNSGNWLLLQINKFNSIRYSQGNIHLMLYY